jgi:hypothetical protein
VKKIGDLMKEIGFNPHSSESVKEAFVKYLIKQSTGTQVQTPTEKKIISENPKTIFSLNKTVVGKNSFTLPAQLSFDLDQDVEKTVAKKII